MTTTITIPRKILERIKREAELADMTLEEYIVELLSQNLDPRDKALNYIDAAKESLEEARGELSRGNVRQAAEKLWGSSALVIKAYAYWSDGKKLSGHGKLWSYARTAKNKLGEWIYDVWMSANGMHICFYEGWCSGEDVEEALKRIEKLVKAITKTIEETI